MNDKRWCTGAAAVLVGTVCVLAVGEPRCDREQEIETLRARVEALVSGLWRLECTTEHAENVMLIVDSLMKERAEDLWATFERMHVQLQERGTSPRAVDSLARVVAGLPCLAGERAAFVDFEGLLVGKGDSRGGSAPPSAGRGATLIRSFADIVEPAAQVNAFIPGDGRRALERIARPSKEAKELLGSLLFRRSVGAALGLRARTSVRLAEELLVAETDAWSTRGADRHRLEAMHFALGVLGTTEAVERLTVRLRTALDEREQCANLGALVEAVRAAGGEERLVGLRLVYRDDEERLSWFDRVVGGDAVALPVLTEAESEVTPERLERLRAVVNQVPTRPGPAVLLRVLRLGIELSQAGNQSMREGAEDLLQECLCPLMRNEMRTSFVESDGISSGRRRVLVVRSVGAYPDAVGMARRVLHDIESGRLEVEAAWRGDEVLWRPYGVCWGPNNRGEQVSVGVRASADLEGRTLDLWVRNVSGCSVAVDQVAFGYVVADIKHEEAGGSTLELRIGGLGSVIGRVRPTSLVVLKPHEVCQFQYGMDERMRSSKRVRVSFRQLFRVEGKVEWPVLEGFDDVEAE